MMRHVGSAVLATVVMAQAAAPPVRLPGKLSAEQLGWLVQRGQRLAVAGNQGDFDKALTLARAVEVLRTKVQGPSHWETINARFEVERWARLAKVPVADRKAVGETLAKHNQAGELYRQGKYAEALSLNRDALAVCKRLLGEGHPHTAQGYNNVAYCLGYLDDYAEALRLHGKALKARRQALGEQHPDTARSYNNAGSCLRALGRHAEALTHLRKGLEAFGKSLGEGHPHTARSYIAVAYCLQDMGRPADALPLHRKAMEALRTALGEGHPDTALSYNAVAYCLSALGRHAEALPLLRKSLEALRTALPEGHPDTAQGYNAVAYCLQDMGRPGDALPLLGKALEARRAVLGEGHTLTAASYNNVAACLDDLGRHAEALTLHGKALEARRTTLGEGHLDTAASYNNVAACLHALGRHAEALTLHDKALEARRTTLGEGHPDTAQSYNNAASCLGALGRHAEALPLLRKALEARRVALGEGHPDTAASYNNVASCLHALGRHAEALTHLRKALVGEEVSRLDASTDGFSRSLFIASRASPGPLLACLLAREGQALAAWQHAESALARGLLDALNAADVDRRDNEDALNAELARLDGRILPLIISQKLSDVQKQQLDALTKRRGELRSELAARRGERSASLVWSLDDVQKRMPADAAVVLWLDVRREHWACVLHKHGSPVWEPLIGSGKDKAWTDGDVRLTANLYDALVNRDSDPAALVAVVRKQRLDPLAKHLAKVDRLFVIPVGQMARVPVEVLAPEYKVSYAPSASLAARSLKNHRPLRAGSLLALGDPVFTSPTAPPLKPPSHGVYLQAVVPGGSAASAGLKSGDVLLEYDGKKLLSPADLKTGDGKDPVRVLFWRDGKEESARMKPGRLGVLPDKRPAAEALRERDRLQRLLASRGEPLAPLPGTWLEVKALAGLVPNPTTLLGSNASEQELRKLTPKLPTYNLIHLATHGQVDLLRPTSSALVLAQDRLPTRLDDQVQEVLSGNKPLDGRLTVGTILRDWKLDADLVVLSACETGLGKDAGGEGLLGFAQAFLQKGARSVVVSRWKVDDAATTLLMTRFYENLLGKRPDLKKPLPRAEALAQAKAWLKGLSRKDAETMLEKLTGGAVRGEPVAAPAKVRKAAPGPPGERPFAHPYYWAAFVLIGDPD